MTAEAAVNNSWGELPGAELVSVGLDALERGEPTVEALLVAIGASRLRHAGLDVPALPGIQEPELALYSTLCKAEKVDAHSAYNALIRRLVSFERALEARVTRPR
ncbi:MAG: hypothetical protein F4229_02700 [Gammaproteobacteria bacterium]|nr:hypothetical protein [Gammaproteobacteria bacterium]